MSYRLAHLAAKWFGDFVNNLSNEKAPSAAYTRIRYRLVPVPNTASRAVLTRYENHMQAIDLYRTLKAKPGWLEAANDLLLSANEMLEENPDCNIYCVNIELS